MSPRQLVCVLVAILSVATMLGGSATHAQEAGNDDPLMIGSGPLRGIKQAAAQAISELPSNSQCRETLKVNRLAALMLASPNAEIVDGDRGIALSPASLSRNDSVSQDIRHKPTYSDKQVPDYRRAHWNPGVGLWQIDEWDKALTHDHGDRIATYIGGVLVARWIRDGWCSGGSAGARDRIYRKWLRCRVHDCWDVYVDIYNSTTNELDGIIEDESIGETDGGVIARKCRFKSDPDDKFWCRFVNTKRTDEGFVPRYDPEAVIDPDLNPFAYSFFSFTHHENGNKFAEWLVAGTNFKSPDNANREVRAVEPKGGYFRASGRWSDQDKGSTLQVRDYSCPDCWYSAGITPHATGPTK